MAPPKATSPAIEIEVGDRDVRISNPDRVYFPARGETKLDLVDYYLRVGDGIVNALRERPCMLHRFPDGREPARRCTRSGCRTARRRGWRPCGCTSRATTGTPTSCASPSWPSVIWAVQMSTVEFHPWNSRRADTEKPDEWRIDLDPMPRLRLRDRVRRVAHVAHEVLDELGAVGLAEDLRRQRACTSTCGSSPSMGFTDVRRAALAFAREVERRAPDDVTTTWWRKDRDPTALFVDYNQNARDHTIAAPTRCAATPRARSRRRSAGTRSTTSSPRDFTIATVPARFAELGDLHAGIDDAVFSIDPLLEWAERDEREGAEDPGGLNDG